MTFVPQKHFSNRLGNMKPEPIAAVRTLYHNFACFFRRWLVLETNGILNNLLPRTSFQVLYAKFPTIAAMIRGVAQPNWNRFTPIAKVRCQIKVFVAHINGFRRKFHPRELL